MAAKKRNARKASPRTTRTVEVGAPGTPPKVESTKGPRRRQLMDGKTPHDPVTHGDLIAYGLVDVTDVQPDAEDKVD